MKRLSCGLIILCALAACSRTTDLAADKLVLRSAVLRAVVSSLDGVEALVRQKVEALAGSVISSEHTGDALTVVFRVPSAKLDGALATLEALATRVESRQVRGEDFTEEYVDLEAQRSNLTATRDRLVALLQQAQQVTEALEVNKGLSEVQGQLDRLAGRSTYLKQAAALSTVTATFVPEHHEVWQPLNVARGAADALRWVLQSLVNLLIIAAVFTPLWGPAAWLIHRRRG